MSTDPSGSQVPAEGRPVARLAEALAAAQAIARTGADDVELDLGADLGDDADPPVDQPSDGEAGDGADDANGRDAESGGDPASGDARSTTGARRPSKFLYLVMALLVLCVPAFGYVGYTSITHNKRGQVLSGRASPDSPGYEALVEPTPTALVIQKDSQGAPVSLTLLSLSGPNQSGGAVVGIPVTARLVKGVDAFHTFGDLLAHGTTETEAKGIAAQLGIGFTDSVGLDDATIATLVKPLGTLQVDNPVDVTARTGETFPKGPLTLEPNQVAAYMGATDADGSETAAGPGPSGLEGVDRGDPCLEATGGCGAR